MAALAQLVELLVVVQAVVGSSPTRRPMKSPIKSFLAEFKTFALRGNALDLAIGVVIGAAFTAVTNSLVTNIITPPIGLLIGGINFSSLGFTLGGDAVIGYGVFIQTLINFLITAFALFLLVKLLNRLAAIARKEQAEGKGEPAQKSPELQVLEEIRDALRADRAPAP